MMPINPPLILLCAYVRGNPKPTKDIPANPAALFKIKGDLICFCLVFLISFSVFIKVLVHVQCFEAYIRANRKSSVPQKTLQPANFCA